MAYSRWLEHHGVKGQNWGVHNGPPYPLDRSISDGKKLVKANGKPQGKRKPSSPTTTYARRNAKKANDIYETLSDEEKFFLTADEESKRYVNQKEYGKQGSNVYSLIEQYKDVPVSVIDIWQNGRGGADVSIAVRNEEQFRHKGYASRALENGIKYFYDHPELEYLIWGVNEKNRPSIELAKKYGFYLYDKRDDGWETYTLDQKRR